MSIRRALAHLFRATALRLAPAAANAPAIAADREEIAGKRAAANGAPNATACIGSRDVKPVKVEQAPEGTEPTFTDYDPEGQAADRLLARQYLATALRRYSPRERGQA